MEKNCIFKDTVSIMGGRVGKNPNLEIRTHFSREGGGLKKEKGFLNSQGENILIRDILFLYFHFFITFKGRGVQ